MNRRHLVRLAAGGLFLFLVWIAWTQNQTAPAALKISKVLENLYEIEGDGGNVAVRVTN